MKILCLSDIHDDPGWHDWILREAPGYDLVVLAGDLLYAYHDIYPQMERLHQWFKQLDALNIPILVCCGNHDCNHEAISRVMVGGISVAIPWDFVRAAVMRTHWFDDLATDNIIVSGNSVYLPKGDQPGIVVTACYYAMPQANDKLLEEGAALQRQHPGSIWVVAHHIPPLGKLGSEGMGDPEVENLIWQYQPELLLCGHDHSTPLVKGSATFSMGNTTVINPGHIKKTKFPHHVITTINDGKVSTQWVRPDQS